MVKDILKRIISVELVDKNTGQAEIAEVRRELVKAHVDGDLEEKLYAYEEYLEARIYRGPRKRIKIFGRQIN